MQISRTVIDRIKDNRKTGWRDLSIIHDKFNENFDSLHETLLKFSYKSPEVHFSVQSSKDSTRISSDY